MKVVKALALLSLVTFFLASIAGRVQKLFAATLPGIIFESPIFIDPDGISSGGNSQVSGWGWLPDSPYTFTVSNSSSTLISEEGTTDSYGSFGSLIPTPSYLGRWNACAIGQDVEQNSVTVCKVYETRNQADLTSVPTTVRPPSTTIRPAPTSLPKVTFPATTAADVTASVDASVLASATSVAVADTASPGLGSTTIDAGDTQEEAGGNPALQSQAIGGGDSASDAILFVAVGAGIVLFGVAIGLGIAYFVRRAASN